MSFFRKLKDRMFKSSSKLDEGLDAIIEEGAGEERTGEDLRALSEHRRGTVPDPRGSRSRRRPPETAVDPDIPPQFLEPSRKLSLSLSLSPVPGPSRA
jgi:fused signal recognition particle receptor